MNTYKPSKISESFSKFKDKIEDFYIERKNEIIATGILLGTIGIVGTFAYFGTKPYTPVSASLSGATRTAIVEVIDTPMPTSSSVLSITYPTVNATAIPTDRSTSTPSPTGVPQNNVTIEGLVANNVDKVKDMDPFVRYQQMTDKDFCMNVYQVKDNELSNYLGTGTLDEMNVFRAHINDYGVNKIAFEPGQLDNNENCNPYHATTLDVQVALGLKNKINVQAVQLPNGIAHVVDLNDTSMIDGKGEARLTYSDFAFVKLDNKLEYQQISDLIEKLKSDNPIEPNTWQSVFLTKKIGSNYFELDGASMKSIINPGTKDEETSYHSTNNGVITWIRDMIRKLSIDNTNISCRPLAENVWRNSTLDEGLTTYFGWKNPVEPWQQFAENKGLYETDPLLLLSCGVSLPTPTNTANGSNTPTLTMTPTLTYTLTPTGTFIPTLTFTPTRTLTPTLTYTLIPTKTPTPTYTLPPTSTKTQVPTPTYTLPPTSTKTPVPTPTYTLPPTSTKTPVPTPTYTLPPTSTKTPVPTSTPQPSPTPTTGITEEGETPTYPTPNDP